MLQKGDNDHSLTSSQSLTLLENINDLMCKSTQQLDVLLRRYITIYVQHHSHSEEFFNALCEHNILLKLFTAPKSQPAVTTLEIFNLLLANTNKQSDLAYIFSQPILHQYLFQKFKVFRQTPEAIEYYIQLLKTMIMKMSNAKDKLIKLFCNSRFPTFPLLTVVTVLGIDRTHEYLVRVTAHQCVLLLINLINQKQTGKGYLTELQMVVFYYELVRGMTEDLAKQDDGSLRYLVDLMYALRNNPSSLSILMNVVVNVAMIRHLDQGSMVLQFLRKLRQKIAENEQFPSELSRELMQILYRIAACIFSNQLLNFTYYSTLKIIPTLRIREHPNLLAFYQQRCKKISSYLEQAQEQEFNKEKEFVYEQWTNFSNKNSALYKDKANKKRSSFVEFFTTKATTDEEYVRDVMVMAGLDYNKCSNPVFKLAWSTKYQTALFLVEQVVHKYSSSPSASQFQDNFVRERLWLNEASLNVIVQIYRLVRGHEHLEKQQLINMQNHQNNKLPPQYYFLCRIKQILSHYLFTRLLNLDFRPTVFQMSIINKLIFSLTLKDNLDQNSADQFISVMLKLQQQIGEDLFDQERFRAISSYVLQNKEKIYFHELSDKDLIDIENRKKTTNKFLHYELIKRLLDSSLHNLHHFLSITWKANFYGKDIDEYRCLMAYKDELGHRVQVLANEKYGFTVQKTDEQSSFLLCEEDALLQVSEGTHKLNFKEYKDGIRFSSLQKAYNFNEDLRTLYERRKETIRSSIYSYIQMTFQAVKARYNKGSNKMQTPK